MMNVIYTNMLTVEAYNALHKSVGWDTCKPERVQMALGRADFLSAAYVENKAIGMARVMHDGLQALVMDVIVKPEYQGKGIGKTLMTYVMEYLADLSQDGGIKVNLISAPDKVGFYEQFGFIKRPTENLGPGMTLWLEKKVDAI